MNKPLIYIIVLNYNRRDDTLDCLSSLFRLDYPNFKVLMVDNASSDGTADAVRRQYPQAEVLQNEKNLMYAGGNNAGIELALEHGADWVLLLNNDTVVDERLLSEMVDAAHAHPEAGVLGPMIYYYPPKGGVGGGKAGGAGTGGSGSSKAMVGIGGKGGQSKRIWYAGGIVKLWMGLTAHRGLREKDTGQYGEGRGYGLRHGLRNAHLTRVPGQGGASGYVLWDVCRGRGLLPAGEGRGLCADVRPGGKGMAQGISERGRRVQRVQDKAQDKI